MKIPFLTAKRIYLRSLNEEDLQGNYIKWLNDPEVCQFNSHHFFPYNQEQGKQYIQNTNSSHNKLVLAIVTKKDNIHIGNISLQQINYIDRSAEYAIIIGEKKYWGQGYAKEASDLIVKHGFVELNLNRIYCGTSEKNFGMIKLAKALNMKKEGLRRKAMYKNGNYHNIIEFGLLRREYLKELLPLKSS